VRLVLLEMLDFLDILKQKAVEREYILDIY
jgi:hypothetical protein